MKRLFVSALLLALTMGAGTALAEDHWVGPWGTAPQLVEPNNNPPSPGLGRQLAPPDCTGVHRR